MYIYCESKIIRIFAGNFERKEIETVNKNLKRTKII